MLAAVERVRGRVPIDEFEPLHAPPADVRRGEVCALSGMAPNAACPRRRPEWLAHGAESPACTWHHATDEGLITILPPEYQAWAAVVRSDGPAVGRTLATNRHAVGASQSLRDRDPLTVEPSPFDRAQGAPSVSRGADSRTFTITSPLAGAVFLLDPTLRPEFQTMPLRVRGATGRVEWFVDDAVVGSADASEAVRWPLARGTHTVRARDGSGRMVETRIVVR
jgi:hypothetical protein